MNEWSMKQNYITSTEAKAYCGCHLSTDECSLINETKKAENIWSTNWFRVMKLRNKSASMEREKKRLLITECDEKKTSGKRF